MRISDEEYGLLVRIAFLISDAKLAETYDGFAEEMNVDPAKNRAEADRLVNEWEHMP